MACCVKIANTASTLCFNLGRGLGAYGVLHPPSGRARQQWGALSYALGRFMAIPACLLRRSAPSSIYHLTSGEAKQLGSCEFSDPRTLRQSLVFRSGRLHTCHRRLHAFQRVFQSIAFNRQALVSRPSLVEVRSERLESYHGGVSCRVAQCYWHSIRSEPEPEPLSWQPGR